MSERIDDDESTGRKGGHYYFVFEMNESLYALPIEKERDPFEEVRAPDDPTKGENAENMITVAYYVKVLRDEHHPNDPLFYLQNKSITQIFDMHGPLHLFCVCPDCIPD